jgi:hypothetical protein
MSFDPATLLMSLLVSSVGFVLLVYGKKQARVPHLAVGIVLVIYPFFIKSALLMALIGAALIGLLIGAVRLGW